MSQTYLDYQVVSGLYKELRSIRDQVKLQLQTPKYKGDIHLTSQLLKMDHDISILIDIVNNTGQAIVSDLQMRYRVEFKWLKKVEIEKPKLEVTK